MTTIQTVRREDAAMRRWFQAVVDAAQPFADRWSDLKRVDPEIYRRLTEQRDLFDKMLVTGTPQEIEAHGAAMVRGYAKAVQVLDQAPDDGGVVLPGRDPRSGLRVAIGWTRGSHGDAVWITPDEVAAILANLEALKPIIAIKRLFPGAEILDVKEPA